MSGTAIAAQIAELVRVEQSMFDLQALPGTLDRATVAGWIQDLSERPERERFDVEGKPVPAATLDALMANLALDAIPANKATRYGMVLERAALRTFTNA